jgi:FixJ family two-component response regulator
MTSTSAFATTSDPAHPWPRVWVHDDDAQLVAAVTRQLRATAIEVTTFDSTNALLVALGREGPNCLVLPLGPVGRALLESARSRGTRLSVVLISDPVDVGGSVQAMKDGAADVLARPVDLGALLAAVMRGLALDAEWREALHRRVEASDQLDALTPREREVLGLVATGKGNRHIAAELGTSEKTVKVHRGRVMHKLQAKSIVDLVRLLANAGLAPV